MSIQNDTQFTETLASMRTNAAQLWKDADSAFRFAVESNHKNGDVNKMHRLIDVMVKHANCSNEAKTILRIAKRFIPHKVVDGKFTKKQGERVVTKAHEEYSKWVALRRTLKSEIKLIQDQEKPKKTPEQVREQLVKQFQRVEEKLLETGMATSELVALFLKNEKVTPAEVVAILNATIDNQKAA